MAKGKKRTRPVASVDAGSKAAEEVSAAPGTSGKQSKRRRVSPDQEHAKDKAKRIWREAVPSAPANNGFHTYKVDALDHAETDIRAYEHLTPLLKLVATQLSKPQADLRLWDPYFCKGSMVKRLGTLGFNKVHNVNEDFYAVIASGTLPEHDVIISSPPYSGDHLERCLKFCAKSTSTWCLLLPNWVESRPYFEQALGKEKCDRLFYIAPARRYTYWMPPDLVKGSSKPEWVGEDGGTSPYDSTWYVCLPRAMPQKQLFTLLTLDDGFKKEWVAASSMKAARWLVKKQRQVQSKRTESAMGPQRAVAPVLVQKQAVKRKDKTRAPKKNGEQENNKKHGKTICFD